MIVALVPTLLRTFGLVQTALDADEYFEQICIDETSMKIVTVEQLRCAIVRL